MLIGNTGLNTIANQVDSVGYQVTHRISQKIAADTQVSNFGGETKIGSSKFQQANEQAVQEGQAATAQNVREMMQTFEQFTQKLSYTKNATLEAIRQSTTEASM